MDITETTKKLNHHVQQLKSKYSDPPSTAFIDFYCQYREGCDYLFPVAVKRSIRLFDILNCFFECIEAGKPTRLVQLMWQDVAGPTLHEYLDDEKTEKQLISAFSHHDLDEFISHWDLTRLPTGEVQLILRELLDDISQLETEYIG
ncbi:MAG: hypothetical protein ACFBSC_12160 [Microcoleaceae cyanobacterium]